MKTADLPPLPSWQSPQGLDDSRLGTIIESASGKTIDPETLVANLVAAPRIIVGEKHDNPDHHALELWLVQALASRRAQGSVLLEMLDPNQQSAVENVQQACRAGQPPDDVETALKWQPGWSWALYGPLVSWQLCQPFPLLSANLDRDEIQQVFKTPSVPPGQFATQERVQEILLQQIRDSHCGLLPEARMMPMLRVQQHRDRRMAERLAAAPVPSLLIAGGYHARKDVGVPLHLQDMGSHAIVVMLAETGSEVAPQMADYVWYTAAQPVRDYCAEMRQQYKK